MADDDRADLVVAHEPDERSQVAIELAPGQPAERLRGEPQRVGQRQPDANGPEIDPEDPPARVAQCEPGGCGVNPGLAMSLTGRGCSSVGFAGVSAASRSVIALSDG